MEGQTCQIAQKSLCQIIQKVTACLFRAGELCSLGDCVPRRPAAADNPRLIRELGTAKPAADQPFGGLSQFVSVYTLLALTSHNLHQ